MHIYRKTTIYICCYIHAEYASCIKEISDARLGKRLENSPIVTKNT